MSKTCQNSSKKHILPQNRIIFVNCLRFGEKSKATARRKSQNKWVFVQALISLFRSCYDDPRDVKQILTKITKLAGYVKLAGNTLVVLLDWIEDKKHRTTYRAELFFVRFIIQMNSGSYSSRMLYSCLNHRLSCNIPPPFAIFPSDDMPVPGC